MRSFRKNQAINAVNMGFVQNSTTAFDISIIYIDPEYIILAENPVRPLIISENRISSGTSNGFTCDISIRKTCTNVKNSPCQYTTSKELMFVFMNNSFVKIIVVAKA